eukprot:CAMPEP_0171325890 /NCGR_PEP_ID=MMETSP0816-20121228/117096_1 /TAXON_ID=420281 /ORGANISM="Proboscia inermis, Strain CCAP1064/1" /LENGTH=58 /DNA_ID=CAMNT_0011825193 /DNA_START=142 /DNA_END=318 /DNA_ORIENTATION=+
MGVYHNVCYFSASIPVSKTLLKDKFDIESSVSNLLRTGMGIIGDIFDIIDSDVSSRLL